MHCKLVSKVFSALADVRHLSERHLESVRSIFNAHQSVKGQSCDQF